VVRPVVRAAVAGVMVAVPVVVRLRLRRGGVVHGVADVTGGIVGAVLRLSTRGGGNSGDGEGGEKGLGESVSHRVLQ
jgi:hypothetical protein